MIAITFVLGVVLGFAACEQIPFIPCEDGKPVTALYITPCNGTLNEDNVMKCVMMHGVEAKIEAAFIPPFDSSSLQIVTSVNLDGLEAQTPYSGYDGCYGSIVPRCPVVKGQPYLFSRLYRVQSEFPVGSTSLKLVIRDMGTKKIAACVKVPLAINPNPAYYYQKA